MPNPTTKITFTRNATYTSLARIDSRTPEQKAAKFLQISFPKSPEGLATRKMFEMLFINDGDYINLFQNTLQPVDILDATGNSIGTSQDFFIDEKKLQDPKNAKKIEQIISAITETNFSMPAAESPEQKPEQTVVISTSAIAKQAKKISASPAIFPKLNDQDKRDLAAIITTYPISKAESTASITNHTPQPPKTVPAVEKTVSVADTPITLPPKTVPVIEKETAVNMQSAVDYQKEVAATLAKLSEGVSRAENLSKEVTERHKNNDKPSTSPKPSTAIQANERDSVAHVH